MGITTLIRGPIRPLVWQSGCAWPSGRHRHVAACAWPRRTRVWLVPWLRHFHLNQKQNHESPTIYRHIRHGCRHRSCASLNLSSNEQLPIVDTHQHCESPPLQARGWTKPAGTRAVSLGRISRCHQGAECRQGSLLEVDVKNNTTMRPNLSPNSKDPLQLRRRHIRPTRE